MRLKPEKQTMVAAYCRACGSVLADNFHMGMKLKCSTTNCGKGVFENGVMSWVKLEGRADMGNQKLKPGNRTESNVQTNLTIRLRQLGFDVQQEVVPHGYPNTRFDNAILNRSGEIVAVVECKNEATHCKAIKIGHEWRKSEQGVRYRYLSENHNFKLFFCGGESEIGIIVRLIQSAFPWWKRLFLGV